MAIDWLSNTILLPELHAVIGAAVVFGSYLLLSGWPPRRPDGSSKYRWNRLAIAVFLAIDLVKEAFWDPVYEVDNPFVWQGMIDFSWYLVGVAVGLALVAVRFRKL